MLNEALIVGRLVREPEIRHTKNGTAVCSYTLAVNRMQNDKEYCDFIDVTSWGRQAEQVKKWCHKGDKLCVEGEIRTDKYEDKNGESRTKTYVVSKTLEFMQTRNEPKFDELEDLML